MPGVRFRADNVGERPVTLTDLMVGLGRRSSWTTKLARAVHPFNRLYGIDEMEGFGTYGGTPFLPKQLSPGASLFIELNGEEILNWVTSESKSGSPADRVVGIFYDDIGLSYPTPVMPIKILKDHVVKISPRKLAS